MLLTDNFRSDCLHSLLYSALLYERLTGLGIEMGSKVLFTCAGFSIIILLDDYQNNFCWQDKPTFNVLSDTLYYMCLTLFYVMHNLAAPSKISEASYVKYNAFLVTECDNWVLIHFVMCCIISNVCIYLSMSNFIKVSLELF